MPDLALPGCRPEPLMSYLKALGVFRLVAKQADPAARLWWDRAGHAVLRSNLDEAAIDAFFLDEYRPSPITSPWNGGGGYFREPAHKEAVEWLDAVAGSSSPRLARLRAAIEAARRVLAELGLASAAEGAEKERFLRTWRAVAPEDAIAWLDAAIVLTDAGLTTNPLLGSGGNDGRLDFSKSFAGCLPHCVPLADRWTSDERAVAQRRLAAALRGADLPAALSVAVGQFHPTGSGLPNTTSSGREPGSFANPWDVVLMLEGGLLFAGGAARRLGDQEALFPFTSPARGVMRLGRSLAPGGDSAVRGETWLPLWTHPVSLPSLRRLLAEGRAQDGRAQARSGRMLSRAVATLGVDRGIGAFQRVVYAQRFGRNFVAVPVDRAAVRASREVEVQRGADWWLDRVRRVSAPSVRDAVARVDAAAYETARGVPGAAERWLLALADAELAVARQHDVRDPTRGLPPLDGLRPEVARLADDGSAEFRLACALASVGRTAGLDRAATLRELLEPVTLDPRGRLIWHGESGAGRGLLQRPLDLLIAVARSAPPPGPGEGARLGDVRAFLHGRTDDARLVRLALAVALCRPVAPPNRAPSRRARGLDRIYASGYLAARSAEAARPGGAPVPVGPAPLVVTALAAGAVRRAATLALVRLRADGLAPFGSLAQVDLAPSAARRVAAALAFPLHPADRPALEAAVLAPMPETQGAIA